MTQPINELQKKLRRSKYKHAIMEAKELFVIAIATIPYALVVNQILVPHAIVGGGLTGICEIIYFATGTVVPIWLSSLVINIILLIIAIKVVGWKFCIRSIYGVFFLTLWLKLVPTASAPLLSDPFMAVILAGLFNGCGLGLVFLNNGSTGGTDIVAMIVHKFRQVPLGRVLLMCDMITISCAYFLPEVHSVEKVLFGLCYTFMCSNAVDWTMGRARQSVQFFIFSQKYDEITKAILTEMRRGVTLIDGEGGYTRQPIKIITVMAKRSESSKIFRIVREIDPDAFISESQTKGVFGQGFTDIREHE